MNAVIGLISLSVVIIFFLIIGLRKKAIRYALLSGLLIRSGLALMDFFLIKLPDSGNDTQKFEELAWQWSQGSLIDTIAMFPGPNTFFYSWFIALFYNIFDRSTLMAQSLSVFVGCVSIVLTYLIARTLWSTRIAVRATWLVALFPTLALYSSLLLRESFIIVFFMVAIYGIVLWANENTTKGIAIAILGFTGATFFHGAFAIGGIAFLIYISANALRNTVNALQRDHIRPKSLLVVVSALTVLVILLVGNVSIPKLGSIYEAANLDRIVSIVNYSARGGASYPDWTQPQTPLELIVKAPIRVVYFLFSPFPWDIRNPAHLMGLFDGVLYLLVFYFIFINRKKILKDRACRAIIFVSGAMILAFALAIGNFGTGIRHRSKFIAAILIIGSPFIKGIRMHKITHEK